LAGFSKWHLSAKARSGKDGQPDQRHWRPNFAEQIFLATSRCRNPTSDRLFETSRRHDLWDSVLPTKGLPLLLETCFKKAHGAPVAWETFQRRKPKTKLEFDKIGGMVREAIYPHSHVHIFESLPGLNMYFSSGYSALDCTG